jgi:predicted TIM-barrel fold metal-dependent hydrolase
MMTRNLDLVVDADNHYYETPDAFTRYLPKEMRRRGVEWADMNGRKRLLVGGKVSRVLANPTFDPIARPGTLISYFRAENKAGLDPKEMFGELDPLSGHPEYVERTSRLAVMDSQGVDGAMLFPTLGVLLQLPLAHDVDALHATFSAFNRWLLEEWGFSDRVYAAPVVIMADPEQALAEVNWALESGARVLAMIPGPVPNRHGGSRSPAAIDLDPVWRRINDAGITVAFHGTSGALDRYISEWEQPNDGFALFNSTFNLVVTHGRTMFDTMAAMITHGLFGRFPNLRIATVETGSNWVGTLLRELEGAYGKRPQGFAGENPVETFKRHVWVSPFFEDDMAVLRDQIGAECMIFGSDWPHTEGLPQPRDFLEEIPTFDDAEVRAVMGGNAATLLELRPA